MDFIKIQTMLQEIDLDKVDAMAIFEKWIAMGQPELTAELLVQLAKEVSE